MVLEEGRGHLRASHADREQAIEALKAAFAQEQPAKAESETRAGQALASRTYAELAEAPSVSRQTVTLIETGRYLPSLRWHSRSRGSSTRRSGRMSNADPQK